MSRLYISPEAREDLLEIWLYIAADSPENADTFLDRLYESAERLAQFPELGNQRFELAENVKSFPVGRYLLFYRSAQEGVELVRVLSAARDVKTFF